MYYLDTNVVIAYVFIEDNSHGKAKNLLGNLKGEKFYISPFTLLEASINSCIKGYRVVEGLEDRMNRLQRPEDRCRYLSTIIVERLARDFNLEIIGDNYWGFDQIQVYGYTAGIFGLFKEAIEFSARVNTKAKIYTGDLLHLVYAHNLFEKGLVRYFVTLDEEFLNYQDVIEEVFQLEVLTAKN